MTECARGAASLIAALSYAPFCLVCHELVSSSAIAVRFALDSSALQALAGFLSAITVKRQSCIGLLYPAPLMQTCFRSWWDCLYTRDTSSYHARVDLGWAFVPDLARSLSLPILTQYKPFIFGFLPDQVSTRNQCDD